MIPATTVPQREHPKPLESFWRALTTFDRSRIDPWMGVRNAIGITLPLAMGVATGYAASGATSAIGAINVAAADGIDSYRNRAARMLTASVICGTAVFLGGLASHYPFSVALVRILWAFAAGLAVCLGQVAADIATISLVIIIIYSAQNMTPAHAAASGSIALAAGLLQTLLSIAPWPIRGREPERRAIGNFYLALAKSATTPANPFDAPLASQQSTQAQEALTSSAGDHSVESERLFALVSQGERIRLALFALARNVLRIRRDEGNEESVGIAERFLELAANVLRAVGLCLYGEPLDDTSTWLEIANALAEGMPESSLEAEARVQMFALCGQLRAAVEIAGNATVTGEQEFRAREERVPWNLRLSGRLATLRANLSLDASACRHAIRLAICIALGEVIIHSFSLTRAYWLEMTVALVLKPDFGNTFTRGTLRLGGTYAGLLLATVLVRFVSPQPMAHVAMIGILALTMRSVGRANYGVFVTALSALIVFLFSLTGVSAQDVIAARALNTTVGGALALTVYLVWPTRERTQIRQALAKMLDSYRVYLATLASLYLGGQKAALSDLDRLRVNGRRARSNVETSVDRLAAEPFANAAQLRLVNAMLASSHRFVHAAMALEAAIGGGVEGSARDAFGTFARDLDQILSALAAHLRGDSVDRDSLPNLRRDQNAVAHAGANPTLRIETDRLTNSLDTLAEQVFRFD